MTRSAPSAAASSQRLSSASCDDVAVAVRLHDLQHEDAHKSLTEDDDRVSQADLLDFHPGHGALVNG